MAGLQRSAISFRRQGSSGSVWDDKFLAELDKQQQQQEQQQKQEQEQGLSTESNNTKQEKTGDEQLKRSKSNGGRKTPAQAYKTMKVPELEDPPSPKVAACGFCGGFGSKKASKSTGKRK